MPCGLVFAGTRESSRKQSCFLFLVWCDKCATSTIRVANMHRKSEWLVFHMRTRALSRINLQVIHVWQRQGHSLAFVCFSNVFLCFVFQVKQPHLPLAAAAPHFRWQAPYKYNVSLYAHHVCVRGRKLGTFIPDGVHTPRVSRTLKRNNKLFTFR